MTNPIPNSPKIPNPNSTSHQSPHTPHPFFCPTTPPHSDYSPFPKKLKNQQTQTKQNKTNLFLCFSFLSFFLSLSFLPCLFPRITQIPSRKKLGFFPAKRKQWYPPKTTRIGSSITTWSTISLSPVPISLFQTRVSPGPYRPWMVLLVLGIHSELFFSFLSQFRVFQFSLIGVALLASQQFRVFFLGGTIRTL